MRRAQDCSELTSRITVIRPEPPVKSCANATTVLGRKGSLRRASRALASSVRLWQESNATGGSGGITPTRGSFYFAELGIFLLCVDNPVVGRLLTCIPIENKIRWRRIDTFQIRLPVGFACQGVLCVREAAGLR